MKLKSSTRNEKYHIYALKIIVEVQIVAWIAEAPTPALVSEPHWCLHKKDALQGFCGPTFPWGLGIGVTGMIILLLLQKVRLVLLNFSVVVARLSHGALA